MFRVAGGAARREKVLLLHSCDENEALGRTGKWARQKQTLLKERYEMTSNIIERSCCSSGSYVLANHVGYTTKEW